MKDISVFLFLRAQGWKKSIFVFLVMEAKTRRWRGRRWMKSNRSCVKVALFLEFVTVQWCRLRILDCTHHGFFFSAFNLVRNSPGSLFLLWLYVVFAEFSIYVLGNADRIINRFLFEVSRVLICTFLVLSLHCLGVFIVAELVCCPVATGAVECWGSNLDAPPVLQISSGHLKKSTNILINFHWNFPLYLIQIIGIRLRDKKQFDRNVLEMNLSHSFCVGICPYTAYIYLEKVTDQRFRQNPNKACQLKRLHPVQSKPLR